MKKEELRKSLHRMGIPTYPNGKVQKSEILTLPFNKSGMEISSIKSIKTEQHPKYCLHRIHLKIEGGDAAKIDAAFTKNKKAVESKLTHYYKALTNGMLNPVEINLHSRNNTNCWLDLLFFYNPEAIAHHDFGPFCYHMIERD